jgi:hypothetical protein
VVSGQFKPERNLKALHLPLAVLRTEL